VGLLSVSNSVRATIGVIFVCLLLGSWWTWTLLAQPATAFLPSFGPGEWITFGYRASLDAQRPAPIPADFSRELELTAVPQVAVVRCAALRSYELFVNGQKVSDDAARDEANWKQARTWDIKPQLQVGKNQIVARVRNSLGPPAWWCAIEWNGQTIVSDAGWTIDWSGTGGLPARSVRLVPTRDGLDPVAWQDRRLGSVVDAGETSVWRMVGRRPWAVLAIVLVACGAAVWLDRQDASIWRSRGWWIGASLLWVALFLHNAGSLRIAAGFDGVHHLAYVQYLLDEGRLPSASQGFQMYQPPLYHGLVAVLLKVCGLTTSDAGAGVVIRLLGMVLGLAQINLIYASLKLLFPEHPRRWVIGLLVGAALPAQLYLYHYVTNEALLTTLLTASLYLTLRALKDRHNPTWLLALLGLTLGAAMMTKVTALLLLPLVFGALATRLIIERRGDVGRWWQMIVLPAVICLVLGGWFYARTFWEHGKFVVTNTDDTFQFWQWPGLRTASDLVPQGAALSQPFFAGFVSLGDGLYSSLWGDGLLGGEIDLRLRPPWDYELMSLEYWAALVPTVLVAVGLVVLAWNWFRRPDSQGFLLLSTLAVAGLALVAMSFRWPFYSMPRAFYGLMGALAFCALAACGFDWLAGAQRWRAMVLSGLLFIWMGLVWGTYWVPRSDMSATLRGFRAVVEERADEALVHFDQAIASAPGNGLAHFGRGLALDGMQQASAADEAYRAAAQRTPHDPEIWIRLAETAARRGEDSAMVGRYLEQATAAAPDSLRAWLRRGEFMAASDPQGAKEALRTALTISPGSGEVRFQLAGVLAQTGQRTQAAEQWEAAALLEFQAAEALLRSGIAWAEEGQPARAIEAYRAALAREPRYLAEAAKRLSAAELALGNVPAAIEWGHQAVRANGQDAEAHLSLGRALLLEGSTALGIASLRSALRLDRESQAALTLAWVLATHPEERFRRPEEALRMAQQATQSTRFAEDPRAWDVLAAARAAGGDVAGAERAESQALELAQGRPGWVTARSEEMERRREGYRRAEAWIQKPSEYLP
jgi:tetratricopeptide (TPR) repeat protein